MTVEKERNAPALAKSQDVMCHPDMLENSGKLLVALPVDTSMRWGEVILG